MICPTQHKGALIKTPDFEDAVRRSKGPNTEFLLCRSVTKSTRIGFGQEISCGFLKDWRDTVFCEVNLIGRDSQHFHDTRHVMFLDAVQVE